MSVWQITPISQAPAHWQQEWDGLNRKINGAHPMLDSRFVAALLVHFGAQGVHLCRHGSAADVEAYCLLRQHRNGMWTTFLPAQAQIGPVLISDWGVVPGLVRSLPGLALSLDLLCLDPDYGFPAGDIAGDRATTLLGHALTMNIALTGGFDAYWAGRSKKLVQNMRRYAKRWAAEGPATRLVRLTHGSDMHAAVARYGDLESSGWKGRAGTAVHIDNIQGRFYLEVMECFARTGNAVVYEYWQGERLAAARLAITSEDMILMLKTAYDESLSELAPGRLLLHDLLKLEFEGGSGGRMEFYTDATQDQLAWATGQRLIQHATFYRGGAAKSLVALIRQAKRWLRR